MSNRPAAVRRHRFVKGQTVRILEGGKSIRKAVEAVLRRYNRGNVGVPK